MRKQDYPCITCNKNEAQIVWDFDIKTKESNPRYDLFCYECDTKSVKKTLSTKPGINIDDLKSSRSAKAYAKRNKRKKAKRDKYK